MGSPHFFRKAPYLCEIHITIFRLSHWLRSPWDWWNIPIVITTKNPSINPTIPSGWWFETWFYDFHNIWNVIPPIDELHHFSKFSNQPSIRSSSCHIWYNTSHEAMGCLSFKKLDTYLKFFGTSWDQWPFQDPIKLELPTIF